MKKCKYCGTERENNVQFCPNCSASAVITEEERANALKEKYEEERLRNAEKFKMKPRTKIIIALCAVVVVVIMVVVMIASAISAENNRVVSDGKTNNQISQEYDEVKNLYSNEEYEEALALIEEIPSEYKNYDDVQKMKSKIIDSYSTSTISKVDEYVANEQYSDALSLLTTVLSKTNNHEPLKTKYDEVLSECKTSYLVKAQALANKKDYSQAISTLETISTIIPSDADIDAKILEYKKAVINDKLSEYEDSKDYVSAIAYLEQQLTNVSNDVDLTAKLNSYKTTYKETVLSDAESACKTDGYEVAITILNEALNILPDNEDIKKKISDYEKAIINDKLSKYESSKDYASAITYLEEQLPNISNDVGLTTKLNSYKATYKETVFTDAGAAYKTDGYQAAVTILNEALNILPNDKDIEAKISNYNSKAPVFLYDLPVYSGDIEHKDKVFTDINGKSYNKGYLTDTGWGDSKTVYYLNNEYERLTGRLVFSATSTYDRTAYFYDDDTNELLGVYTLGPKSVDGLDIDINLTNVKFLRIEFDFSRASTEAALVNATLFKKI